MSELKFVAMKEVVDSDLGGDRALLDLKNNTYFTLNPTGAEVWNAMQEPQTLTALVEVVTDKFDVSADLCRPDIEQLLQQLISADLVVQVE
jgi:hypothetical protein